MVYTSLPQQDFLLNSYTKTNCPQTRICDVGLVDIVLDITMEPIEYTIGISSEFAVGDSRCTCGLERTLKNRKLSFSSFYI